MVIFSISFYQKETVKYCPGGSFYLIVRWVVLDDRQVVGPSDRQAGRFKWSPSGSFWMIARWVVLDDRRGGRTEW